MAAPDDRLVVLADIGALPDACLARYAAWLGESEGARLPRFVRAERRRQFVAGRALLRLALAPLLGRAPQAIALLERPGKAPALADPALAGIGLSIAHTGPWVGCAVSMAGPVGFDIERIDPARDVLALAEQAFAPREQAELRALDGEERLAAFYRHWCAHEALVKLGRPDGAVYPFTLHGLACAIAYPDAMTPPPEVTRLDLKQYASLDVSGALRR